MDDQAMESPAGLARHPAERPVSALGWALALGSGALVWAALFGWWSG